MMGVSLIGSAIVADCTGGGRSGDLSQSGGGLVDLARLRDFLDAPLTREVVAAGGCGAVSGRGSGSGSGAGSNAEAGTG
jgi:hypothetical protein